jgi:hypothetical protein
MGVNKQLGASNHPKGYTNIMLWLKAGSNLNLNILNTLKLEIMMLLDRIELYKS